jgi:3-oxoacyl-[acyl-carrier-protein] synthase II
VSAARVYVRAAGAVTPAGTGIQALLSAVRDPNWQPVLGLERPDAPPLPVAVCREFTTKDVIPPLLARRLDRPSRLLAVAAREALRATGEPLPWARERVGVTAGTWNAGTSALVEVLRAVFLTCPDEAPPAQFPSTVANAPASQLGILDKLGGPNITFAEKQVGGLRAVAEAARLLLSGRADAVVACGVDEGDWLNAEGYARLRALAAPGRAGMVLGEGAGVLLLACDQGKGPLAALVGWGSASAPAPPHHYPADPAALAAACAQALARAGIAAAEVELVVSAANGVPALAALEVAAMDTVFGGHRPAAVGIADRLGEGAAGGSLRAVIAALTVAGDVLPAWGCPLHLAAAGYRALAGSPRTALVGGLAGGGSAVALVFTTA